MRGFHDADRFLRFQNIMQPQSHKTKQCVKRKPSRRDVKQPLDLALVGATIHSTHYLVSIALTRQTLVETGLTLRSEGEYFTEPVACGVEVKRHVKAGQSKPLLFNFGRYAF